MKISLKLLKEYIVNNDKSSVMKFKSIQDRDVWLQNAAIVFQNATIEDLNNIASEIDRNHKSGKLFLEIYSSKLSELVKDLDIKQMNLNEIYNELQARVHSYKTNESAAEIITNIIGSSICNFLRMFSDVEIIDFIKRNTEYNDIIINFMRNVFQEYIQSKGKVSYGLSEYTLTNCLRLVEPIQPTE